MYSTFRQYVQHKVSGSDGAMNEFCSGVAHDDPRLIQLVTDHPEYNMKCVPVVIHGDGVPCTNNHALDAISFESIFATHIHGVWAQLAALLIAYSSFLRCPHRLRHLMRVLVWATPQQTCGR